jgi:putative holliday junction resolvase
VRRGVRVGVDVGSVRIGVARSDPDGLLATPERTITTGSAALPEGDSFAQALGDLVAFVRECDAMEVIVGLPLTLAGASGAAAVTARSCARALARGVAPIPVRLVDERLTTVSATRRLREAGVAGRRQRAVVDQAAAVVILQGALDAERASGRPPGQLVHPGGEPEGPAT